MMSGFKSSIQSTPVQRSTPAANASQFALERVDPIEIRAVIAYPSLVEPDANAGGKYGALFLITEVDDQTALIELRDKVIQQTFRSHQLPAGAHDPLRRADERAPNGEYAFKHPAFRVPQAMVIRAKTGYQPKCVWGPAETPTEASEIRGGDHVVVEIGCYGYNNQSRGVGLSLGRIWLIRKGDVRIERGANASAAVRRIDRSRLQFSANDADNQAA
jgi:hypothetical protein